MSRETKETLDQLELMALMELLVLLDPRVDREQSVTQDLLEQQEPRVSNYPIKSIQTLSHYKNGSFAHCQKY